MRQDTHPRAGRLRRRLRRHRRLRSAYYFLLSSWRALAGSAASARAELDRCYATGPDPWRYASSPHEQERYRIALEMVGRWWSGDRFEAFEVGCGEGFFTAALAPHCSSVLAVDISDAALARAREACAGLEQVRFAEWDARTDAIPGQFELVVCMDAMAYIRRPFAQRRATRSIARCVRPGGLLLVTEVRQGPLVEGSAWGGWLGLGARAIVDRFANVDDMFVHRESHLTERHVVALFEARR